MPHTPQHVSSLTTKASLQERLHALNATSSAEASALAEQGKHTTTARLVFAPFITFVRAYLGQGEWHHGLSGLISAIFAAYGVFLSYTKLWEQQNVKTTAPPPPQS
jgi:hypothetical protein